MSLMLLILWCGHHATPLLLLFPLWRECCLPVLVMVIGTVWVLGNRWMGHGFVPSQPSDIGTGRPLALALHHSDDAGDAALTIRRMASLRPFMEVVSPVSPIATGCFTRGPLLVFRPSVIVVPGISTSRTTAKPLLAWHPVRRAVASPHSPHESLARPGNPV